MSDFGWNFFDIFTFLSELFAPQDVPHCPAPHPPIDAPVCGKCGARVEKSVPPHAMKDD